MDVLKFEDKFYQLSLYEKTRYIDTLITKYDLKIVIFSLLSNNSDVIESFSIINSLSKNKKFKQKYKLSNVALASLMINTLIELNKTKDLVNYFSNLDEKKVKVIVNYEVKNNTSFSHMKLCKDLYKKYNLSSFIKKNTSSKKVIILEDELSPMKSSRKKPKEEEDIKNQEISQNKKISSKKEQLKKGSKNKKAKYSIVFSAIILTLVISYLLVGYLYSILFFYNSHIYPNVYLDGKLIEGQRYEEVEKYLKEKELFLEKSISLKNANDTYIYKYKDIGIKTNSEDIKENLIREYQKLNGFQKLLVIFLKKEVNYEVTYWVEDIKYQEFLTEFKEKVNLPRKEESFKVVNGKIVYKKGVNGFLLDETSLSKQVIETIKEGKNEVFLTGKEEKIKNTLSLINKKVASYSTYYNESQGRARNIKNAVNKLNGKMVYPGDIFSFYKTVGPYNGSQGYIFYGKDVGSGVCQVSTTIYNVQLLLNLPIISRYNHGEMVYYVPYGMDATVYGSSVDYKFKNNTNYPIYIEATASNGTLTVSFWSNENIIEKGYNYKPRVEKIGGLSYKTYLDTYYNGKLIKSVYLNSSRYSKGK